MEIKGDIHGYLRIRNREEEKRNPPLGYYGWDSAIALASWSSSLPVCGSPEFIERQADRGSAADQGVRPPEVRLLCQGWNVNWYAMRRRL